MKADICVIGAGSGGLSIAAGAAQMGAKVVLLEKHKMGGDCLNYGCVPSKALLAASKYAHNSRKASLFGIHNSKTEVNFQSVHDHIQDVIGQIAPHDSVERFESLGVKVISGAGKFIDHQTVAAGDQVISAKKIVISTGSSAFIPPIKGLNSVKYLTNETIFNLTQCPEHIIIIGGGPIGIEMAQAMVRLGAKVTVITDGSIMPKDDPELVQIVRQTLISEGINLVEHAKVDEIINQKDKILVKSIKDSKAQDIKGSHILIATGRIAALDGLDLECAGIGYTPRGIKVDNRLRTSNKNVYAIGDCIGSYQFTHVAGYHAGIIVRNILFKMPAKVDMRATPWVTYTDPELAHVGMDEDEARKKHGDSIRVLRWSFKENDRAVADRRTEGLLKVIVAQNREVLGASIVGYGAGEQILPWVYLVQNRQKINAMTGIIAPYPTLSEVSKRISGQYFTPALYSDKTRFIVKMLMKLPF